LRNIPQEEFSKYAKYINNNTAYVIVHPFYYQFFRKSRAKKISPEIHKFMLLQVNNEKNFFSYAIQNQKLVILVMPGNSFSNDYIEFMNDLTRGNDSIIYVSSKNKNSGNIIKEDLEHLNSFFQKLEINDVMIGGGYVGRCQEKFYSIISKTLGQENVAIVPEVSTFSPYDLTLATVKMFLTSEGLININAVNHYIKHSDNKIIENNMNLKNMKFYE
jgi:hypothetical protein